MKIVIFHDYFMTIGGAEKLVLILARALGADIITTDLDTSLIKKMGFNDVKIISIGKTIQKPILRQVSSCIRFALCDFHDDYDFFIFSGNWAHFASKKHKPNILYCHTPAKAFYENIDYIQNKSLLIKLFFKIWIFFHKYLYEYYMNHIQLIVTNSKNTELKVKKYLHRDVAKIIYPPIDCDHYAFQESGNFWLSVNRLYPEKRIELQLDAFKMMPEENLVIVGSYAKNDYISNYAKKLKHDVSKNISFCESITEKEIIALYSRCKGFISTAKDEDFGMAVLEAMASGKPVVCVKEGGYLESVIDKVNGFLVEPNVHDIVNAVKIISKEPQKYKNACKEQAKKFDISIFIKNMKKVIQNHPSYTNT